SAIGQHLLTDPLAVDLDLLLQRAHLFQQPLEHPTLILVELPVERLGQFLELRLQSPLGQRRQTRRIALAFAHRADHRPPTHTPDDGRYVRELDVALLQHTVDPIDDRRALVYQLRPMPRQLAPLPDFRSRHETPPQ